jgi:hypothetical protein
MLNAVKNLLTLSSWLRLRERASANRAGRFAGRALVVLGLLFSGLGSPTSATELTDLGQGLSYLRVPSLAGAEAALRQAVPGAGALVLDLRYTAVGEDPAALAAALTTRPAGAALFVLVSPATPPALGPALGTALTLGAPGSVPAPKVVVQTDAAADRRAYDALTAGTPLEKLLSGKIAKERFDEATLVREFKDGNTAAEPPPTPNPTATPPDGAAKDPATVPPTDRVLQRAVHLHRSLLALRKR